jgi:hypothetical protein
MSAATVLLARPVAYYPLSNNSLGSVSTVESNGTDCLNTISTLRRNPTGHGPGRHMIEAT